MITTNLSSMARMMSKTGKAVFKDVGESLAAGIWEEFVVLVNETPQYTGTTAASWQLFMKYRIAQLNSGVRTQEGGPFEKGHQSAVQVALRSNINNLKGIGTDYTKMDLIVLNNAPGAERSESGKDLRAVNAPGGALFRFQNRVSNKMFPLLRKYNL